MLKRKKGRQPAHGTQQKEKRERTEKEECQKIFSIFFRDNMISFFHRICSSFFFLFASSFGRSFVFGVCMDHALWLDDYGWMSDWCVEWDEWANVCARRARFHRKQNPKKRMDESRENEICAMISFVSWNRKLNMIFCLFRFAILIYTFPIQERFSNCAAFRFRFSIFFSPHLVSPTMYVEKSPPHSAGLCDDTTH